MGGLIAVLALAGLAGGLVWLYRHEQSRRTQQDAERYVLARARGWRYAREGAGDVDFRFAGESDGVAWEMWFDSDRSSKGNGRRPRAIWRSANLRSAELALLITGRRRYEVESGTFGRLALGAVGALAGALSGRAVALPRQAFYEYAVENEEARGALRERFAVLQSPRLPPGWLDVPLQAMLRQWPDSARGEPALEATLGPDGLQLEARGVPADAAFWQRFGELGLALAQRLARTSAGR